MFASHYLLHTILSKAIADMLLMNGALTQHQCTVVVVVIYKNLYNINKLLGGNREKKLQKDLNNNSPHLGYRLHSK